MEFILSFFFNTGICILNCIPISSVTSAGVRLAITSVFLALIFLCSFI